MTTSAQPARLNAHPPRDVLIIVPGLGHSETVNSTHVADLLCWEMNQRAEVRDVVFSVTPLSIETDVVHRIERRDGAGSSANVLDVYAYDSVAELDRDRSPTNPVTRTFAAPADAGSRRGVDGLQQVIDRVWQRPEVEAVHGRGYSFGCLVALETAVSSPACGSG